MAQVPYDGGAPTVAPETRAPDDYQRIDAKPEQFGGLIAKGAQQLGAGTEKAAENVFDIAQFRGKVNTDYEGNNFIDYKDKLFFGDPSKPKVGPDGNPVLGPDGKPMPDTGYMGLQGREAADQRQSILDQLKQRREQGRSNLKSPQEQLEYDNQTRRIYAEAESHIGIHAEQQWKQWAGGVNQSGAQLSLNGFLRNLDNGPAMASHARDFINFRMQEAHLKYGYDPQIEGQALAGAKQELLKAQVDAVGVHNPKQAIDILEKNRNIAGTQYDDMYNRLRARKQQQGGIEAGAEAFTQAQHGVAPGGRPSVQQVHAAIIGQESGGNPNIRASIDGAHGIGQIMPATFAQWARPGERIDNPADNLAVSQRIIQSYYDRYHGDPARVAVAYFSGPGNVAPEGSPTPWIRDSRDGNGKSVASYAQDIQRRVGGAAPTGAVATMVNQGGGAAAPAYAARKADAYQIIADRTDLDHEEKVHAYQYVNQTINAQEIAENQNARARKDAVDHAAGGYTTEMWDMMHSPNPDYVALAGRINHDPVLADDWRTKDALMERLKRMSGEEQALSFGPGYLAARQGLFSGPDAPGHINDFTSLVERTDITTAGLNDLKSRWALAKRSVDRNATERQVNFFLQDAKSKLSFEQDMGSLKIRDPKGEHIFNAEFAPKFVKRISELADEAERTGDHKKLDDFLTSENVSKMIRSFRDPRQMAAERLSATGEAAGDSGGNNNQPLPPTPDGLNPAAWVPLVRSPPRTASGKLWPLTNWAENLEHLHNNPTPEVKEVFDRRFGKALGLTADQVIAKLGAPTGATETLAAPAATPAAARPNESIMTQNRREMEELNKHRLVPATYPPNAKPTLQ